VKSAQTTNKKKRKKNKRKGKLFFCSREEPKKETSSKGRMDWLYVWSPRYRFFHEFLFSRIQDLSGFCIQPVFAEQKLFPRRDPNLHFFTGNPIKIYVITRYIEKNLGKSFFFTDVDLIVLPTFSREDLDNYLENDITCMKESPYNIGCLLIQCNQKTLSFFQRVLERIVKNYLADQDAFIAELPTFEGKLGVFSSEDYVQSNMIPDYKYPMIVQCLTCQKNPTDILLEKILTISRYIDFSHIQHHLPEDVLQRLRSDD
jgi:hypothetical protein